jgi:uncharacterized protein (TIGR02246 family)
VGSNPEAVVSAYFDALNRSDAQALASLFEEDGVFIGEGAPATSGREAIQEFAAAAFAVMRGSHQFEVDRVEQGDGLAVVQTHSAGTLTLLDSATTSDSAHRELYVLRSRGEGWRISQYMYNSAEVAAGGGQ